MSTDTANCAALSKNNPATLGWVLPLLVAGGAVITLVNLLAGPLALPLLSLLLLGAGFGLAAALLLTGQRVGQGRGTAWVVAGAVVFLGFAAALLSDGPEALAQLDRLQTTHSIAAAGK